MGHYMTKEERIILQTLLDEKKPVSYIAKKLGCCRQTVYNEIRRGQYLHNYGYYDRVRYSAERGQKTHDYNQTAKGRPLKIGSDHAFAEYIERKIIKDRYSPAAALAAARKESFQTDICVSTLYSYIDKKVFYELGNQHLWEKRKRKPSKSNREKRRIVHPTLPSIEIRPERITNREEYGHWEMDLIVSGQKGRSVLLTLTERQRREEIIMKLPDRKAETIRKAIDRIERRTQGFRNKFKSITTDNGSEFMEYDLLRKSCCRKGDRFDLYYCHSYAAWEKGSVENHNRMIRRFFPKGTNFDEVSTREVQWVQDWLNGYPRKVLGWRSPNEAAA